MTNRPLSDRERIFAEQIVQGKKGPQAVEIAGFNPSSSESARAIAYQLSQRNNVKEYIKEIREQSFAGQVHKIHKMLGVLVGIATDKTVDPKTRASAAKSFIDCYGFAKGSKEGTPSKVNFSLHFQKLMSGK